ncbi:MAG: BRO-N domain-containing protein, partial [Ktedonobacterales bacterium]
MSLALIEEQAESSIRRVWHDGRMYFSVVDVVGVLTESTNPGIYWRVLKLRLKDEEGAKETVTKCNRLRMQAADGKQRLTDAADTETLLRIIQSIPSPKAEPVKQWLARTGARRLDEVARPLDAGNAGVERAAVVKPSLDAPALSWAEYYEQLAVLYRRQAAYETQIAYVEARLDEHGDQIGELHSRMES